MQPPYSPLEPPSMPQMSRNVLDTLEGMNSIAVRQDLQWLEEILDCLEQRNKYKVSALPLGLENRTFSDNELKALPMLYDVREDSTKCCRCCCGNSRAFKLGFFPEGTPHNPRWPMASPLMTLERPFKCTCWCGKLFCPQEIWVSSDGKHLGKVEQECRCFDACCRCTAWARSFDPSGVTVHTFRTPFCGRNCCAPSCLNYVFTIEVLDPNDESRAIGMFKNIWPGCKWRGLCSQSASNYVVTFPSSATKEDKALLIGSLFLHDFMYFERESEN